MSRHPIVLAFVALLTECCSASLVSAATEADHRQAVQRLGDRQFAVREEAQRFLWQQGPIVEPLLKEALLQKDAEVRRRAQVILEDFRYGIVPGALAEDIASIRRFRTGDPEQRQAILQLLLARDRLEVFERLLSLESDPNIRRQLLDQLFRDEKVVERFIQASKAESLVRIIGADQDQAWRRATLGRILFSPKMIERQATNKKLDDLLIFLKETPEDRRSQYLWPLLRADDSIHVVLKHDGADFLNAAIATFPDQDRANFFIQYLSRAKVAEVLNNRKQFWKTIENALKDLKDPQRLQCLDVIVSNSENARALSAEYDAESLVRVVIDSFSGRLRGQVLAAIVSSYRLSPLREGGSVLETINKDADIEVRRGFLEMLTSSRRISILASNAQQAAVLWKMMRDDGAKPWQLSAAAGILGQSNQILADREQCVWLLTELKQCADSVVVNSLYQTLCANTAVMQSLLDDGHLDELQELARSQPKPWNIQMLGSLVGSPAVAKYLFSRNETERLVSWVKEGPDATTRFPALNALINNSEAMARLVQGPSFDELSQLVLSDDNADRRAGLWGDFVCQPAVLAKIREQGQIDSLLAFAETNSALSTRRAFLQRLFRSEDALLAIIETNHFLRLLQIVEAEADALEQAKLQRQLFALPKIAQHLITLGKVDWLFDAMRNFANDGERQQAIQIFLWNHQLVSSLISAGHLKKIFDLVNAEPNAHRRVYQLTTLLQSSDALPRLAADNQLDWLKAIIRAVDPPPSRSMILQSIVYHRAVPDLLTDGHFPILLELIEGDPDSNVRGTALGQLISSSPVLTWLDIEMRLNGLLSKVQSDAGKDDKFRAAFLRGVCTNPQVLDRLLGQQQPSVLMTMLTAEPDRQLRGELFVKVLQNTRAVERILASETPDALLEIVKQTTSAETRELLQRRLLCSDSLMAALARQQRLEEVVKQVLANTTPEEHSEITIRLLATPSGVDYLNRKESVANALKLLQETKSVELRREVLQQIFSREKCLAALLPAQPLSQLFDLIRQEPESHHRQTFFAQLLNSQSVRQEFTKSERWGQVLTELKRERTSSTRDSLLRTCLRFSEFSTAMRRAEDVTALLDLIGAEANESLRAQQLAELFASDPFLTKLAEMKMLGAVLTHAQSLSTGQARHIFAQHIVFSSRIIEVLLDAGLLEQWIQLSLSIKDPVFVSSVVSQQAILNYLVKNNELDRLVGLVKEQADLAVRWSMMEQLVASQPVVQVLVAHDKLDEFIAAAGQSDDSQQRILIYLLLTRPGVELLLQRQQLAKAFDNLELPTNSETCQRILSRLRSQPEGLTALISHGQLDRLLRLVEDTSSGVQRAQFFLAAATTVPGAEEIVKNQRTPEVMQALAELQESRERLLAIQNCVNRPVLLAALLEQGGFDQLWNYVTNGPQESVEFFQRQFVINPTTLEYLAKTKRLEEILKTVRLKRETGAQQFWLQVMVHSKAGNVWRDPAAIRLTVSILRKDSQRTAFYRRQILNSGDIRQAFMDANLIDLLKSLIDIEPDTELRGKYLRNLVFSPTGIVASHLRRGEHPAAERLLEESAEHDDWGRARLAAYLLVRGGLDARIALSKQRIADEDNAKERRLLVLLLRANGDLSAASEMAEHLNDSALICALQVERGDWARLASTPVEHIESMLRYWRDLAGTPGSSPSDCDPLAFLAVASRLAGRVEQTDENLDRVRMLARESTPANSLRAVSTLLMVDRVEEGLAILEKQRPDLAFQIRVNRQEYDEALRLVGCSDSFTPTTAWFEKLPAHGSAGDLQRERSQLALRVVDLYRLLGRPDQVSELLTFLERWAAAIPNDAQNGSLKHQIQIDLTAQRRRDKKPPQDWWSEIAFISQPDNVPSDLYRRHPQITGEIQIWWRVLRRLHPNDSASNLARRVDELLRLELKPEEMQTLIVEAERIIPLMESYVHYSCWLGLGKTCIRLDRHDDAKRFFSQPSDRPELLKLALAELCWQTGAWTDAAKHFEQIWETDREKLSALYLAGHSWKRAGELDAASRCQTMASELALDGMARTRMADEIAKFGLAEEALQQYEMVVKTAPPEQVEWRNAANRIFKIIQDLEPQRSARVAELMAIYRLVSMDRSATPVNALAEAADAHQGRARAMIAVQDWVGARRELAVQFSLAPGQTDWQPTLLSQLAQAGRLEDAEEIFRRSFDHWTKLCERYPRSAFCHNQTAWLAATCHRRLQDALRHAQTATQLAPFNGSYHDTLAEVYFHLGQREQAIEHSRQAAELAPSNEFIRQQLSRFRTDPLPE